MCEVGGKKLRNVGLISKGSKEGEKILSAGNLLSLFFICICVVCGSLCSHRMLRPCKEVLWVVGMTTLDAYPFCLSYFPLFSSGLGQPIQSSPVVIITNVHVTKMR